MMKFNIMVMLMASILNPKRAIEVKHQVCEIGQLVFYNNTDTVTFRDTQYKIVPNSMGYTLYLIDTAKVDKLTKLSELQLEGCFDGQSIKAKGLFIYSSGVPNAKYMFPITRDKKVYLFKENTLPITKTGY